MADITGQCARLLYGWLNGCAARVLWTLPDAIFATSAPAGLRVAERLHGLEEQRPPRGSEAMAKRGRSRRESARSRPGPPTATARAHRPCGEPGGVRGSPAKQ